MPKTYEHEEGKKVQEDFEEGMRPPFQVPQGAVRAKKKPAKKQYKGTRVRNEVLLSGAIVVAIGLLIG